MILVLCANAGLDRTYEVPHFSVGMYHQPRRFRVLPGGKGVNVARALRLLGHEVLLTGFAGGHIGAAMMAMLRAEDIRTEFVKIAEESRLCLNIIDENSRSQTQLDEPGPLVSPSELEQLRQQWLRLLRYAHVAIIAGSAPRGAPFDVYVDFIFAAKERRLPVLLDVREPYLSSAVQAGPTIVKPNLNELSALFGQEFTVPEGVIAASQNLLRYGIKMVLTSMGREGAIAVTSQAGIWRARPPAVETYSEVGAGDAMLAGLVHATLSRLSLPDRLRWAVAAGAAAAQQLGATIGSREEVEKLVADVAVEALSAGRTPETPSANPSATI